MFSGLIGHTGRVVSSEGDANSGTRLIVEAPSAIAEGVAVKDSIAIDGVCLTVVANDARSMTFDVVPETIARSTLGSLKSGDAVNVELALLLGDRLGGHLVYGHVDATTTIAAKTAEGQGYRLALELPDGLARYVVEKGFIALDGVSLTVAAVRGGRFEIALIPETASRTTLGRKGAGQAVNVEVDPLARYALGSAEQSA